MKKLSDKLIQLLLKNNSDLKLKTKTFKGIFLIPSIFGQSVALCLGVLVLVMNLTGCQTGLISKNEDSLSSYWIFKTNVYSAAKNKNVSGYTHITYASPKLIRLDVYDPLGLINAGTLIYKDGGFEAILPLEKKYFFGVASPESMAQVLKSPIDPSLFVNIIFQKKLNSKNWVCNDGSDKVVRDCHNRNDGIDILWKKNISESEGWVIVTHSEGEIDLKLKSKRSIKPLADEKFKLRVPNSYSKFKVDANGITRI